MQQAESPMTVAEMAAKVGLSRDRFYDLIRSGIFPPPLYRLDTRRPFYPHELQEICLSVRRTGKGFNGQPVIFNQTASARRLTCSLPDKGSAKQRDTRRNHKLAAKLRYLGLQHVTAELVTGALANCLADNTDQLDESDILQRLVRHFAEEVRRRPNGEGRAEPVE